MRVREVHGGDCVGRVDIVVVVVEEKTVMNVVIDCVIDKGK